MVVSFIKKKYSVYKWLSVQNQTKTDHFIVATFKHYILLQLTLSQLVCFSRKHFPEPVKL